MGEKVSFADAFLLHTIKSSGGRTHSIKNQDNGSILERSKRNLMNSPKERQIDVNGLKNTIGDRYNPQDEIKNDTTRKRRQSAGNCTSVMRTECLGHQ